jgi:hypothetical protein
VICVENLDERTIRDLKRAEREARRESRERNRKDYEYFDPEEDEKSLRYLTKNNKPKKKGK